MPRGGRHMRRGRHAGGGPTQIPGVIEQRFVDVHKGQLMGMGSSMICIGWAWANTRSTRVLSTVSFEIWKGEA